MKQFSRLILTCTLFLMAISVAEGTLLVRGVDSFGNRLIYDDTLDVTWYDFTYNEYIGYSDPLPPYPLNSLITVNSWAQNLSINFGGTTYEGWRLASADVSGYSGGPPAYDGTSPWGFNVTSSEMGNLFYDSLGNFGDYAGDGTFIDMGLTNVGPFENLLADMYYSSTVTIGSWSFNFGSGQQYPRDTTDGAFGLAVLDGDVAPIPEPSTFILLVAGLIGFAVYRKKSRE